MHLITISIVCIPNQSLITSVLRLDSGEQYVEGDKEFAALASVHPALETLHRRIKLMRASPVVEINIDNETAKSDAVRLTRSIS